MDVQSLQSQLEDVIFWTCRQTIPSEMLEIQAIICVTVPSSSHEHVVKIHQTFHHDSFSKCSFQNDHNKPLPEVKDGQNISVNSHGNTQDVGNNLNTQTTAKQHGKRVYTHRKKFYRFDGENDPGNNADTNISDSLVYERINDNDLNCSSTDYIKVERDLESHPYETSYPGECSVDNNQDIGCLSPPPCCKEERAKSTDNVEAEISISIPQYVYSVTNPNHGEQTFKANSVAMDTENYSDDGSLQGSPSELSNSMMAYKISPVLAPDDPSLSPKPVNEPARPSVSTKSKWNMRLPSLDSKYKTEKASNECCVTATIKRLQCSHCGALFSSTRTRKRHEKTTCGTLKFTCELCSKLYSRKDALRRHMIKMHECDPDVDFDSN